MFKKLFKRKDTIIEGGSCYGVLRGDYHGEIFVFFEQDKDKMFFVSLPKMELREVEASKFYIGLGEKILDFINVLPKDVYKVIEAHGKNLLASK
jgi:hypothetical protein